MPPEVQRAFDYDARVTAIKWDGDEVVIVITQDEGMEEMVRTEYRIGTEARAIFDKLEELFQEMPPNTYRRGEA